MENQNGLMLIEHIDDFKRNARQYFESKKWLSKLEIDKKYRVATNFDLYEISDVKYYPDDFEKSLEELILKNPYSQLTVEFRDEFKINIEDHLFKQNNDIIHFHTLSDVGGLKIGNKDFSIIIPNGYGDGETNVYISEKKIHVPLEYYTFVKGTIEIDDYDCGGTIITTLKGTYHIYIGNGNVVFVQVDN